MRVLRHFENFEQKASQLRSVIEDLMRRKLILEADIVAFETFEQIDPAMPNYPIAAQLMKDRRDNLCRTIKILDGKLSELQIRKQLQQRLDKSGSFITNRMKSSTCLARFEKLVLMCRCL